ncbi:MAG: family 43 glycosylhydrolase [Treponema sp.]|nr:family 43 glycosylhydrolase [Treponema sp.]
MKKKKTSIRACALRALRTLRAFSVLLALGLIACQPEGSGGTTGSTKSVSSIALDSSQATTSFAAGDTFTADGLSVTATYSDGTTGSVSLSDCSFSIGGTSYTSGTTKLSAAGSFTVTVTYKKQSDTYTIAVISTDSSSYVAPTYNDNYVAAGLVSFSKRALWNLANTHDPTVFKWTDGYYYMFGTDASYGNEHEKATTGKHFQGKRSLDLVNWDYVPGIMDDAPDWVVTKLNEIRVNLRAAKIAAGETLAATELQSIAKADISFGYWAPVARVITVDGTTKVRLYYSIVVDNFIGNGKTATNSANFDNTWSERAFIGVAETTNPNGGPSAWTDLGFVTCSSSDLGTDYSRESLTDWSGYFYFNAIDPTYFVDEDDTHWMIYGSWHSGFALVRINPSTGKIAAVDGSDYLYGTVTGDFEMGNPWADSADGLRKNGYGTRIFSRGTSRWQPSEGPELIKYNGYYWLFFANDGLDVPYQTRVVRAQKIEGPYYAIQGSEMTSNVSGKEQNSTTILPIVTHPYKFNDADNGLGSCYGWVGISHCAIFDDGEGNWFYMSQQRLPENVADNEYSNAVMMGGVRRIMWTPKNVNSTDVWPMVLPERYGAIPEDYNGGAITTDEIPGTWQHINLVYDKGKMDLASELTMQSDGTMSGALSGTWSFSEDSQQLTFSPTGGTAFVVTVAREVNWESSPRTPTIVYTGCVNDSARSFTYWGKKDSSAIATYADKYASAALQSTYTMTITDAAKNDLGWYLYPQWGTWTYVVDDGSGETEPASVSGAGEWWTGSEENQTSKYTIADGGTLTFYVSTTDTVCTMTLKGYSASANTDVGINYHNDNDCWGEAKSSYIAGTNTAIAANSAQSVKIEITRNGATQTAKIYKK